MIKAIAILMPLFASLNWALIFLFSGKSGNRARFYLSFLLIALFIFHLGNDFYYLKQFEFYFHFQPVTTVAALSVFPLFYQYIRLLTIDTYWRRNYLIHFIPAVFLGLLTHLVHLYHHDINHLDIEHYYIDDLQSGYTLTNHPVSFVLLVNKIFFIFQILFYSIRSGKLIGNYRKKVGDFFSNTEKKEIDWVAVLNVVMIFSACISIVFALMGIRIFFRYPFLLLFPAIVNSGVIFVIGFFGFSHNPVVEDYVLASSMETGNGGTADQDNPEMKEKLEKLFVEDKIYLQANLTIREVTNLLNTNRTFVSNFINQTYGMNFSQFVNHYRVEAVKKMLCDQSSDRYSLETIGELCGFGSLNNFIRVFRAFENMTPGQFRGKCKKLCNSKMHPPSCKLQ